MLITAVVIALLLIALVSTRLSPTLIFICAVVALFIFGEVTQQDIIAQMSNTSVLTLILLMVASLALERSALLAWVSSRIFQASYWQTVLHLGLSTALSSAFLNNTAVVATLMSCVRRNQDHPASKLLIPLSYFAIIGGTMTLIGTSTNLVINGLLIAQGKPGLSFFEFSLVGLGVFVCCFPVVLWIGSTLASRQVEEDISDKYFLDAEVQETSKLIGRSVQQNGLRALDGLFLVEIVRGQQLISPVKPQTQIEAKDKLIFAGDVSQVQQIQNLDGVEVFAGAIDLLESNLEEVLVSPESVLIGKTLKNSGFRARFDAAVVAIQRQGQRLSGKIGDQVIKAGDKLVLAVGDDFKQRHNLQRNFFSLSAKQVNSSLKPWQNYLAVGGFMAAIATSVIWHVSLLVTMFAYVLAMVVTNVVDTSTIRRRFPFELWLILTCALVIATSFEQSGLALWISEHIFSLLGDMPASVGLIAIFFCTLVLTEIITNTAAAAIMIPIAMSLASAYQVSYSPFVMAVTFGASACFISPFGYQTNLMVMNAGGYQIKDFVRVGWKVSLMYSISALVLIQLLFPF